MRETPQVPIPLGAASVRRLRGDEHALYRDFMLGLGARTRHDRFCAGVDDGFIVRHAARVFGSGALVYGCFLDGTLRGVAELHLGRDGQPSEAAFAVDPRFQSRGIGTALLEAVVLAARNRNAVRVRVTCLRTNLAMRRLAQKAEARLTLTLDEVEGEITAPRATPLSWAREFAAEVADRVIRRLRAPERRAA